jgi:hypothetical protein
MDFLRETTIPKIPLLLCPADITLSALAGWLRFDKNNGESIRPATSGRDTDRRR